jgi:hypothetical protein
MNSACGPGTVTYLDEMSQPPKRSLAELPAPSRGPSITELLLAMRHDERG